MSLSRKSIRVFFEIIILTCGIFSRQDTCSLLINSIFLKMIYFKVKMLVAQLSDSLGPRGLEPARLLCPWNFPGKNTRVDCHFLLQGIFSTQELNPGLLHCRQILFQPSYEGSTRVGSHSLLQGIFPTQGSNLGLLHCRRILYCVSHPKIDPGHRLGVVPLKR